MSKIRAVVQGKAVVWDVVDVDSSKALVLEAEGLLEPIDYSIVGRDNVSKGWDFDAAIVSYCYSCVLTYDKSKFKTAPTTWADFWNLKDFPGMRLLRKTPEGQIEACMMAAGRSIKDVYPIDLDLAVAKGEGDQEAASHLRHRCRDGGLRPQWRGRTRQPLAHALEPAEPRDQGPHHLDLEPGPAEPRRLVGAEGQSGRAAGGDALHPLDAGARLADRARDPAGQRAGEPEGGTARAWTARA